MSLRTFLGPILNGTQKNNNPAVITSNTPSAAFLQSGTGNSYRNTGSSDGLQFVSVPQSVFTGIATGTLTGAGLTYVPVNTVQGVNYPIVIPAGSYIDNIDFNITTLFAMTGTTPVGLISVQLIGAPGSTYATAQTVATVQLPQTGQPTIGNYAIGNSSSSFSATTPIVATAAATPLAMFLNTGPTDAMLQLVITASGTTPLFTAGACSFAFSYAIRNPDGTFYPQTPIIPIGNPPVQTY